MSRLKRLSRYLGTSLLLVFVLSWPISYAYYWWDDQRVIRAYGGTPVAGERAVAFLGRYLEQHLQMGMTREDVHQVLRYYQESYVYRQSDQHEYELFILDPLETLFVEIRYDRGRYTPVPNIDRGGGYDTDIKIISLIGSVTFLLASVLPFERFSTIKKLDS